MRAPEYSALRPVNSESRAPTPNSATAVTPIAIGSACGPGANRNGASGSSAPAANDRNDEIAAPQRRAELVRIEPQLLARERVERVLGIGDDPCASRVGFAWRQALRRVDQRQLLRLGLGILLELVALEADLVLEELALRAHRNVFARGHRERARAQAGDAGEEHDVRVRIGARRRRGSGWRSTRGRR